MSNNMLFRALVPDAPLNRRTEGDVDGFSPFSGSKKWNNAFLEKSSIPGLEKPSLVSSCKGSISRILFCFPAFSVKEPDRQGYRSVISALRPGTQFVVAHHVSIKAEIASWLTQAGHQLSDVAFIPIPDHTKLTDWAEDAYVCLTDLADGSRYLAEPWRFLRSGDALIADAVEEYTDIVATQVPLIFQGGNCLIGDNFWMLGKDYFADTVAALTNGELPIKIAEGANVNQVASKLFQDHIDKERKLILIGSKNPISMARYFGSKEDGEYYLDMPAEGMGTYQPIFHIDMFVTLAGTNQDGIAQVLVGSPSMGDRFLKTNSPFAHDAVYDAIAKSLGESGFSVKRNPIVHRATVGRKLSLAALQDMARATGDQKVDKDFAYAIAELAAAGATSDTAVSVRSWHHVTWNNCLVEDSKTHGRHVYIPTYGHEPNNDLAVIDREMEALWAGLGFTVHLLGDFNSFARRQGVVHCIKKYIERGD